VGGEKAQEYIISNSSGSMKTDENRDAKL